MDMETGKPIIDSTNNFEMSLDMTATATKTTQQQQQQQKRQKQIYYHSHSDLVVIVRPYSGGERRWKHLHKNRKEQ